MAIAITWASRLQDLTDVNVTPAVGVDEYVLVYDHDTQKFVLKASAAGVTDHGLLDAASLLDDDHTQYLLATGGRTGASSSIQTFTNSVSCPGVGVNSERYGPSSSANGTASIAIGSASVANGEQSVALGSNATDGGNNYCILIGYAATATGTNAIAIGRNVSIAGGIVCIGNGASATGVNSTVIGISASGNYATAVAIGQSATVSAAYGVAIGMSTVAHGSSVALGYDAKSTAASAIAIGRGARAGANQVVFGSTTTPANVIKPTVYTALTNTVQNVYYLTHNTSGSVAAGFGAGIIWQLESSTTDSQDAALISALWNDATHATRKADLVLSAYDTAEREGLRIRGAGAAAALGFFGHAPGAQPAAYTPSNVSADRAFDADTVAVAELADVVGTLIADLQSLGLVA